MKKSRYRKITGPDVYKTGLLFLLGDWRDWLDSNSERLHVTTEEQRAASLLYHKLYNAKPEKVKPIARRIVAWMDDYARRDITA